MDGAMPKKNPHIGDESPGEYARRRGAREPEFTSAFEEEFDKLHLAREIRLARERRKLSQTELALRVGTKQPHIARLELGKALPRLDVLHRIAAALGLRLEVRLREVAATKPTR